MGGVPDRLRRRKTASGWTIDQMPDALWQAAVAIEDERFFEHNGVDWKRTAGATLNIFTGMPGHLRRLHHHPAGAEEHDRGRRRHRQPQGPGDLPGSGVREELHQVGDPGAVPQHHLSGPGLLRRPDRRAVLLRQGCRRAGCGGVRLPHRHHQQPLHVRPHVQHQGHLWSRRTAPPVQDAPGAEQGAPGADPGQDGRR